jgi:hypothetical protein
MLYEKGKYIVGEINGLLCAVCFTEYIEHSAFLGVFDKNEIWSAGSFTIGPSTSTPSSLTAHCFGKSLSLGVESKPDIDVNQVNRALSLAPK